VRGVWEDLVEGRLGSRKTTKQDKARAGVKSLGVLLVSLGKALDKVAVSGDEDDEVTVMLGSADGNARPRRLKEVAALVGAEQRGRTALAVEALWDEVEPISDWEALLDVLLLDHSASGGEGSQGSRGRRTQTRQANGDSMVDEAWRLEEVEEAILLEVLVAALRKAKLDTVGVKKVRIHVSPSTQSLCI